jgi:hypothetical protein
MKSITAKELKSLIEMDPSWARTLTEPIEITTYANLNNSKITHLSPYLHFSGKDKDGNAASFRGCTGLEVAEGVFDGFVDFGVDYDELELNLETKGGNEDTIDVIDQTRPEAQTPKEKELKEYKRGPEEDPEEDPEEEPEDIIELPYACPVGLKKIGDFKVLRPNNKGEAVDFSGALKLTTYEGTYPGHITIGHNDLLRWMREMSGGTEREKIVIKDLIITGENNKGLSCTIQNAIVPKLTGRFKSAIRLVGSEVGNFGISQSPNKEENELEIQPNLAGTKIELKNNSYPSTIKTIGFAKDFPFEAHELSLPRLSTKKEGDPLTELRDMLKIKKAMFTREEPLSPNDPWQKQIKRYTVRSIAQCLQADDLLKREGHKATSKTRLSKILKTSAIIATILGSFAINTISEIGKEIRENTIVEPTALHIQDLTTTKINQALIKKISSAGIENKERTESKEPSPSSQNAVLNVIIKDLEGDQALKITNNTTECQNPENCCHATENKPQGKAKKKSAPLMDQGISLASL